MLFDITTPDQHVLALIIGVPRIMFVCHAAPFMGGATVLAPVRSVVMIALYVFLHPFMLEHLPEVDLHSVAGCLFVGGLVLKEILLGFSITMLANLAFWTLEGAGMFIDNQRGAAQATGSNPVTGEENSPTGSFFSMSAIYLFHSSGTFLAFLGIIYASYEAWPPSEPFPAMFFQSYEIPLFFAAKVARLATDIVLLSGPVVLACLFVDIGLGIVNRFASQLNVYVLAMPVKSGVVSLLLIFYFGMLMKNAGGLFNVFQADLLWLQRWMP